MKLTKSAIERMVYEKAGNKADLRFDDELRGFGVRIYPSGEKSFFVKGRSRGAPFQIVLGKFSEMSVQVARDMARVRLVDARQGVNPAERRRLDRAEMTLRQFAPLYEAQFSHLKRAWKDDQQRIETHILPHLGSKRLGSITADDLQALQRKLLATRAIKPLRKNKGPSGQAAEAKPTPPSSKTLSAGTVNRIMAVFRHMLREAERAGYLQSSPGRAVRMLSPAKPRDVMLTREESIRILDACDGEANKFAGSLIKVALLSGRRIGELRTAKWQHVNRDQRTLRVPHTKSGDQQHMVLSESVLKIIDSLPRVDGNPHIFAGEREGQPLNNYVKPWRRVLKAAGVEYVPIHGLRHSAASNMVAMGVPLSHVGETLGHKDHRTTQKYAHARQLHVQAALSTLETAFGQATKDQNGKSDANEGQRSPTRT